METLIAANPYPGLRAFCTDEADRFFGREQQIEELIMRLDETPFITVAGTSGCGKSSLVCAGLLDTLTHRSESQGGPTWLPVVSLPGNQPIVNLAKQLATVIGHGDNETARWGMLYGQLQLGGLALSELARLARLEPDTRLLIVIDQFEELFRFKQENPDEAEAFVKLLLNAAYDSDAPLSIIITLRSEFLGACADFAGLPEAINRGQYLVPKLTREQRKRAITAPAELLGHQITPRLVQRILNDVSENFDDLPVMQHALSRTWHSWAESCRGERAIDLEDYERIGTTKDALSRHADEAATSTGDMAMVEQVFRALTQQLAEGVKVRRALGFERLCAVTGADRKRVERVVDRFRRPDTALLRPGLDIALATNPVIDISHESLINLWQRLHGWVQAEAQASAMLRRVMEAARNYESNQGSLWRGPELRSALRWQKSTLATPGWIALYTGSDGSAANNMMKRFLDKSRHRTWLRSLSIVAIPIVIIVPLSINELQKEQMAADLANKALLQTEVNPAYSAHLALAAVEQNPANEIAEYALRQSLVTLETAHTVKIIPFDGPVVDARYSKDGTRLVAVSGKVITLYNGQTFEPAHAPITRDSDIQKALLMNNNSTLVTQSYDGRLLLQILAKGERFPLNCPGENNSAWAVTPSPDDKHLAVGCYNGEVMVWDVTGKRASPQQLHNSKHKSRATVTALGFSSDGQYLASGDADGRINIWKPKLSDDVWIRHNGDSNKPEIPMSHDDAIRDISFSREDHNLLVTAGDDKRAIVWSLELEQHRPELDEKGEPVNWPLPHDREVVFARFTPPRAGDDMPVFTVSGKTVQRWLDVKPDLNQTRAHDDWVTDMDASPNGELLVTASTDGTARIWSSHSNVPIAVLRGHSGQVNRARFSPDGKHIVTASQDGTVRIWKFTPPRELATRDHWILGAQFDPKMSNKVAFVGENGEATILTLPDRAEGSAPTESWLNGGDSYIGKPSWSHDGKYLLGLEQQIALNSQWTPVLWDVENDQSLFPKWLVEKMIAIFSPGTDELVTVGKEGEIAVWDEAALLTDDAQPKHESDAHPWVGLVAMSPDGAWIAEINGKSIELWKTANLKAAPQLLTGHRGDVRSLQFSPDSRYLITASEDRTARIWPLDQPSQFIELSGGHSAALYSASFDKSGKHVVTSSADGTISVWNSDSGKLLATLHWHGEGVNSVQFSPDGQSILSASDDGTVKLGRCDACWLTQEELKVRVAKYAKLPEMELQELKEDIDSTRPAILPAWLTRQW